jgi:hypothetical protein
MNHARRIVRIRNGNIIDRQVLRRLAEACAIVGGVAIAINHEFRYNRLRRSGMRLWMHQVLIANDEYALGQRCNFLLGSLEALDDQCS